MDRTFSPSFSLSYITYVEAEAVEFSRFRFHISDCDTIFTFSDNLGNI